MDQDSATAGEHEHSMTDRAAQNQAPTASASETERSTDDGQERQPAPGNAPDKITKSQARRWLIIVGVRAALAALAVLTLYWLLPPEWFDQNWSGFALLIIGLVGYMALVLSRMRHLRDSPRPMVELGESLVVVVVTLVTLFAFTYVVLSRNIDGAFNVELDKHSALYFSMTVTTTTGFGDIVAQATNVRDVVTFQMFITLLVLAVAIRGVTAAAQYARQKPRSHKLSGE